MSITFVAPAPPPEVSSNSNYTCNICDGLTFGSQVELREHQAEVHNKTDENTLELPIKVEANDDIIKVENDNDESAPTTTTEPQEIDNPPVHAVRVCTVCQNCVSNAGEAELKQLLRESSTTVNNDYTCLLCKKQLKGPKKMAMHVLHTVNDELKYKCHKCDKSFGKMIELNEHLSAVHPSANDSKRKMCPHCTKMIPSNQYAYHVELHSQPNVEKFECDMCKWVFFSSSGLDLHKKAFHEM